MVKSKSSESQLEAYRMAMVYSSSSIRAFGSVLCRFSNGVYHKPHHSCSVKCVFSLTGNFSSSLWHSSSDIRLLPLELQSRNSMRRFGLSLLSVWAGAPAKLLEQRFSNGVHLKPHHYYTLRGVFLLSGNFSSSDIRVLPLELQYRNSVRKIWTFSPLCMGRRSCKIAGRKV